MTNEYPASHILAIKVLDGLSFIVGLALLAIPVIHRFYPGDFDTTVHVTLGSLIAVCAIFRVLVAFGSAWLEIVLCALGVLTFSLPHLMHKRFDAHYNYVHLALGISLIALSIISGVFTFFELNRRRSAR